MTQWAIFMFWILISLVMAQGLLACGLVGLLRRWKRTRLPDEACPKAAVILCVRGVDPFLADCVQALLDQDYPSYDVHVVVDHRQDPAWSVIEAVVKRQQATHIQLQPLAEPRHTCSLKCSSLVQAISGLDESYDVVVQLDADTIPHRHWLRELIAPLADECIGAATGNRWYMPYDASWGAMARYAWNAAAIVPMYWYRIAWGGTLALQARLFRQSSLLDRWGNAFCEDTMLYEALRQQQLRLAFVPSLMMVNREACSIADFYRWIGRQLLTTRLYHPCWVATMGHGFSTTLVQMTALGLLILALLSKHWEAAVWAGGGLLVYQTVLVLLLIVLESTVRRIVRARGEETAWLTGRAIVKCLPAILLAQALHAGALVAAMRARIVEWRGVSYRIDGSWNIRLIEYRPYDISRSSDSIASL